MEKFLIITSREYLNKITNKTFILSTLFTPLILVGLIFLIGWFASVNNDQVSNVSVVDNSGYIFDKLESTESIRYVQLEDFDLEEAKLISKTKSDFGLLFIENSESPKEIAETITFYSEDAPSLTVIGNIENQLENILTNKNYKINDIDINKINSNKVYVSLYQETFQGKKTTKADSFVGLLFGMFLAFLLYMLIFAYGGMIMASVIEEKSSRIFGIKNKGFIKEEYDADLTIVDMNKVVTIKNEMIASKCGWTPFHNYKVKGFPVGTIVNGNLVMSDGKILEESKGKPLSF